MNNYLNFFCNFFFVDDRAMSPAQSEDSGLAADRVGSTFATISLNRDNSETIGITFAGKIFLST